MEEGLEVFKPTPILKSRIKQRDGNHAVVCVCPGFELKKWRYELLADHLMDWLPEFAIRHDDLPKKVKNISEIRKLIQIAAKRVYATKKSASRGELGEILLHAICRQFSGTFPTVSKVYYKTSSNDVVKGFDLVHTRYVEKNKELQLWLGEAKFYKNGSRAVTEAIESITTHLKAGFLKNEKILLGGKISKDTPGYSKLEWLFEKDTPLDKIFERIIIPIMIAYNSEHASSYQEDISYNNNILSEIMAFQKRFKGSLPKNISIYCFYVPMDSKQSLVASFDKKLGGYS